jgi:hypothetical protein
VRYVALRCRPSFQSELGGWLEQSPRFRAFVSANQDKVRKKLTTSDVEESRLDIRAELLVAYLVLADRRFEVEFEAYGARQLGPDLTATFRTNQHINLEVTRLRAAAEAGDNLSRVASVVAGKLRQLPGGTPNALVIVVRGLPVTEGILLDAAGLLKARGEAKDDAFFVRRGLRNTRDFWSQLAHLSGVFVLDEATESARVASWLNADAQRTVSSEALKALVACLASAPPSPSTDP